MLHGEIVFIHRKLAGALVAYGASSLPYRFTDNSEHISVDALLDAARDVGIDIKPDAGTAHL